MLCPSHTFECAACRESELQHCGGDQLRHPQNKAQSKDECEYPKLRIVRKPLFVPVVEELDDRSDKPGQ